MAGRVEAAVCSKSIHCNAVVGGRETGARIDMAGRKEYLARPRALSRDPFRTTPVHHGRTAVLRRSVPRNGSLGPSRALATIRLMGGLQARQLDAGDHSCAFFGSPGGLLTRGHLSGSRSTRRIPRRGAIASVPAEPLMKPAAAADDSSFSSPSQPRAKPDPLPEPKLRVNGLRLTATNGERILQGVTLAARPSNLLALIGPSGSGKSTVLRALNRLWEPPAGTVFLDGKDVTKMDVAKLRVRVGMVFQNPNLFDGTVASNVCFGPALRNRHLSAQEVDELLLRTGVDPGNNFRSRSTNELSGGEAQRVAIARALANDPEVLLLDEPTSALDPTSTRKVEETIFRLKEEAGLTVVLVSHSMEQVLRVADTAALLSKGRVIEFGTPQELRQSNNPDVSLFFSGELE